MTKCWAHEHARAGAVRLPLARFTVFTAAGSALWTACSSDSAGRSGSRHELVDRHSSVLDWVGRRNDRVRPRVSGDKGRRHAHRAHHSTTTGCGTGGDPSKGSP
jgi:hypothetical protein